MFYGIVSFLSVELDQHHAAVVLGLPLPHGDVEEPIGHSLLVTTLCEKRGGSIDAALRVP